VIRVVIFLLLVGALAFGAVWLADRPGDVAITWLGRRIETSVMVLIIAVTAIAVFTAMLWSAIGALVRSPGVLWRYLRARRGVRGYLAVSQGLIAVGSGDLIAARKFAEEAARVAPSEPLTLLLRAQTAQLDGDRATAARSFEQMAVRDDTRLLGLHGLFIEARRRNDPAAALHYAEEAAKEKAVPAWAGQAVLEFRCIAGDWSGALDRLERNMKAGLVDKDAYRRQRAVLLTAQALAIEERDRSHAKALAIEATKLAPAFVPAAALAGRLSGEAGELRRAGRIIEAAWCANPHPDLADAYAHLRPGDSARERLARIQALAGKSPGNIEAALAVARAALDAREFAIARTALAPLAIVPTKRVAALMAELEQGQGDEGRAREWMMRALNARRDPAWTADGFISERWLPISPVSGRLDAFEWKDPLAGDDHAGKLIEARKRSETLQTEESGPEVTAQGEKSQLSAPDDENERIAKPESTTQAPAPSPPPQPRRERTLAPVPLSPAVIPLVHAPDDPGPDPESEIEPAPESDGEQPSDPWWRFRHLFRP
jgi:HemY protein